VEKRRQVLLDAAIIGGGPVGSRTAARLASQGYRVAVLESHEDVGLKPCCTGIVSLDCITRFNIPDAVIYRQCNSADFYSPSGDLISVSLPEAQAAILNRPAFDKFMYSEAIKAGADYYLNSRAVSLDVKSDAVEIGFQTNSHRRSLKARAAILSSGFFSNLVKQLGFGEPAFYTSGAQVQVEAPGCEKVEVYFDQKLAPGYFAWLVPTEAGRALAGLMTDKTPALYLKKWLERLVEHGKLKGSDFQIKQWGIPLKPLKKTAGERILVVGDAAGQVKPTTGGGLYFGLLSADIAADVLAKALTAGNLSQRYLMSYDKEWRVQLLSELKQEYLVRRAYRLLSNRQLDGLFGFINKYDVAQTLLKLDYNSFDKHGGLLLKALKLGLAAGAKQITGR